MTLLLWLAFVVLVVLKVSGYLAISWWVVILPLIPIGLGAVVLAIAFVLSFR